MPFGVFILVVAALGAGWLLFRLASGGGQDARNMMILKIIVLLGVVAALAASRLGFLAFMVLVAAGGVMAIESWRSSKIGEDRPVDPDQQRIAPKAMTIDEAAAFLGVTPDAEIDEIKAAHRKLISQIHPDKGGTDYLAAKINEARELMINARGE